MEYDKDNKLQAGDRVRLIKVHGSMNQNSSVGDVGTVVDNDIFEFTYRLKMDSGVMQLVYSYEIDVVPTTIEKIEKKEVPLGNLIAAQRARRQELTRLIEDVLRNHYDYPAITILMKLEDAGVQIMKPEIKPFVPSQVTKEELEGLPD